MNQKHLDKIENIINLGPYKDTWESLVKHPIASWYKKSKLGIFIHWGVYSVPAYFNEWYPRLMYYKQNPVYWHHKKTYGDDFDYHQFVDMFKAENFNAGNWLKLISACKADFVMPVAEHHDGFKMYKSELNEWNAYEKGPKRDILQEIKQACDTANIKLATSSHRAENYWFMNGGRTLNKTNATHNESYRDFYGPCINNEPKNTILAFSKLGKGIKPSKEWLENWLISSCEIVDNYKPSAFYFDFWSAEEDFRPYMKKFLAYFYNTAEADNREVVSFYKFDAALYPCGVYIKERGQMSGMSADIWQCETSTAYNAWSYCTTNKFKKTEEIIGNMIDVWSKNGCMSLNIGPKSDGSICKEEVDILETLANWIEINEEGIWETMPYRVFGEGRKQKSGAFKEKYKYSKKDFRFRYKLGTLYAFALKPEKQRIFKIYSFAKHGESNAIVGSVEILGLEEEITFLQQRNHLEITLKKAIESPLPICFKITLK